MSTQAPLSNMIVDGAISLATVERRRRSVSAPSLPIASPPNG
jgi:hypothetical protein